MPRPRTRFHFLPLVRKLRLPTDGTTTLAWYELNVPEFHDMLPQAEALILFTLTEGRTNNHSWRIGFASGFDRDSEGAKVSLCTAPGYITASGSVRHDTFSTVSGFNLASRLFIGSNNTSGTALETAVVSAGLGVVMYGA